VAAALVASSAGLLANQHEQQRQLAESRASAMDAVQKLGRVDDLNDPQAPAERQALARAGSVDELARVGADAGARATRLVALRARLSAAGGGIGPDGAPLDLTAEAATLSALRSDASGSGLPVPEADAALGDVLSAAARPLQSQVDHHAALLAGLKAAEKQLASRLEYRWVWQISMPRNRLVLFYGNPLVPAAGALGDGRPEQMLDRLKQQTAAYTGLDQAHPAVGGLDLITPVAQSRPMADGSWVYRTPDEEIRPYVELARANHLLLFFDMQVGHSTVDAELDRLGPYLELPEVSVALDPEFDMNLGGTPGVEFGKMTAAEINAAADRLSALVMAKGLPPKVLIVHQFRTDVLPDRDKIVTTRPGVTVVLCIDGVGAPGPKVSGYDQFTSPDRFGTGFKLFYKEDRPLMSERDVLALKPAPALVMYQ